MLSIIWMLFVAWFLNLFGFGNTVIKGLVEIGGPEISLLGYYAIFAFAGLIKNILSALHPVDADYVIKIKSDLDKLDKKKRG